MQQACWTIVIEENALSCKYRLVVAHGLIELCQQNLQLRVEQRVECWNKLFDLDWLAMEYELRFGDAGDGLGIPTYASVLREVRPWVRGASALIKHGMPKGSFKLQFTGPSMILDQVWNVIKHQAMIEATMLECHNRGYLHNTLQDEATEHDELEVETFTHHFPNAVKDSINGKAPISFAPVDLGVHWDSASLAEQHKGWKLADWVAEGKSVRQDPSFRLMPPRDFVEASLRWALARIDFGIHPACQWKHLLQNDTASA